MPEIYVNSRGDKKFVAPPRVEPPRIETWEADSPPIPDFDDQLREFLRRQAYREHVDEFPREASVETPSDRVGLLVASGDKHFGCEGFDWAQFMHDSKLIQDTNNVYELELGDIVDNLFFSRSEQIFNLAEQIQMLNSWAKMMVDKGKMLASVGGNHQEWMFKLFGVEFYMLAFGYRDVVPYLRDGGDIHWRYGSVDYEIRANHKTHYNSNLNPHHTNHRTYWMVAPRADIIVSAHTHSLTNEHWAVHREGGDQDVYFGKSGSYKKKDRYRDANGHIPAWQTGALCYTVHPFKKEIWQVVGVDKGVRLQEMLNWELDQGKNLGVKTIVEELSR